MARETRIHRLPMTGPEDTSAILAHIGRGEIAPAAIRAILGKTEGNGCVNDFTRAFSVQALTAALGAETQGVAMVMSGGTEGGLCLSTC